MAEGGEQVDLFVDKLATPHSKMDLYWWKADRWFKNQASQAGQEQAESTRSKHAGKNMLERLELRGEQSA